MSDRSSIDGGPVTGRAGTQRLPGAGAAPITRALRALPAVPNERTRRARRIKIAFVTARILVDGGLLVAAFIVAYWLRYGLALGRDIVAPESFQPLSAFSIYVAAYAAITLALFQARGLYRLPRAATWLEHMRVIFGASLVGVSALTLGALLFNPVLPSRLAFIYLWVCTVALFGAERFAYRRMRMWLWRRGINVTRTLVVGAGIAGQRIMKDIIERPELGYKLSGYASDNGDGPDSPGWSVPIRSRNGGLRRLQSHQSLSLTRGLSRAYRMSAVRLETM